MPDPTPFISACLTNSSTRTTVDQTHSNEEKMQHVALEVKIVPWKEISIFLGENLTKKKKQRVLVMHLMGNQKTILQIDLRETPQEQSSSIKQKIFIINNGDQMLGGTALGVVLRLGRLGGSFSSSSQKRHRPLKAPFSLFFCDYGAKWTSLCRGMDQHILKLAFSLRPDMTPWTEMYPGIGRPPPLGRSFCSLCFFVHRCVTVRFGVFTRILWFCVGEGRDLSLDDRHL